MLGFIQSVGELEGFLRVANSTAILAAVGYIISLERRLSRIEGRLKQVCRFPCTMEEKR